MGSVDQPSGLPDTEHV